jgi:hypothetical protein
MRPAVAGAWVATRSRALPSSSRDRGAVASDGESAADGAAGGAATGSVARAGDVDIATLEAGPSPRRDTDQSVTAIRSPAAAAIQAKT